MGRPDSAVRSRKTAPLVLAAALAARALMPGLAEADAAATIAPLLESRGAGALGALDARALADPAKPSLPADPVEGVGVAVLPWSPEVEARLEGIKGSSRDSMDRFIAASSSVRAVLTDWERELSAAGARDLVRLGKTDAEGRIRVVDLPAGEWLVLAWREQTTKVEKPVKIPKRDGGGFLAMPEVTGHTLVRYWRVRLSVSRGETSEVTLTERGVWLSAVDLVLKPGAEPPIGTGPRKQHR